MSANDGSIAVKKESKKPKYSRFTQQELPACKPLLTPKWVIGTFFLVGVIFLPIGGASLAASNGVVEVVQRYDDGCVPSQYKSNKDRDNYIRNNQNKTCVVNLTVPKKMKPPIYVYYQLDNYYQNHRRYVKSRSDSQLRGNHISSYSSCKPEDYLQKNKAQPILPCGLVAWSLFNDSYAFATASGGALPVDESGISWKSDRTKKFGSEKPQFFNTIPSLRGGATLDPNTGLNKDEHLIVWMRTAALPTFRKLWGKINTPLAQGTVVAVTVVNNYNTYSFGGKKKLVMSNTSWLGGKNNFLGIAYLTVGSISILLALLFLLLHLIKPRPLGDVSYLSWNRRGAERS